MDRIEEITEEILTLKDKIWQLQLLKRKLESEPKGKYGKPGIVHKGTDGWFGKSK